MQMLITNILKQLLLSCIIVAACMQACFSATRFETYFQIKPSIDERIANKITAYYSEDSPLPIAQQGAELLQLEKDLATQANHKTHADYWFITGLLHQNLAAHYAQIENLKLSSLHINKKNNAYEKSIALGAANEKVLSAAIYSTMKHGLPANLKIEATNNELKQGGNGDNQSHYWYLHWSNIDQLKKAGRDNEATAAFKKMQKEMADRGVDMSVYGNLSTAIEKRTLKTSVQENKPIRKSKNNTKESQTPDEGSEILKSKYAILVGVIIFAVISLIFVLIRERKK